MYPKKVIVSHPGKQYVHQLLYALQREGALQLFITSIWYKPHLWVYKIIRMVPKLGNFAYQRFLKKKTYPLQNEALIEQHPWQEVKRQLLVQLSTRYRTEKYVFHVERTHDALVAKRLEKLKPQVFIGYEKSSLQSFQTVKRLGGITVLDLAQVHYKYLIELRNTQETFHDLFEDEALFDKINEVKALEYLHADYILTLSSFAKSTLVRHGIDENKIKVVNLGYDPGVFVPKTHYPESDKLKLIYTGTFTRRKGVHLLLEVLEEMNDPRIELTIIGPVLDGEDLLLKYQGRFTYFDFLHHEDLVRHLHASDVYVFPSYLDSWAMTVIEAMACGLPVIITENTGAKDAVDQNETGLVLPIGEKNALKGAINHFLSHPSEIQRMGTAAAAKAKSFQWENYYQQITSFVETLDQR